MAKLNPEKKLAKFEEERKALDQEMRRLRKLVQQQQRRDDTRRKVLIGALILDHMQETESDKWPDGRLIDALDTFLTRDNDRELFGLSPKAEKVDEPVPAPPTPSSYRHGAEALSSI